jgi:hypothetical protein
MICSASHICFYMNINWDACLGASLLLKARAWDTCIAAWRRDWRNHLPHAGGAGSQSRTVTAWLGYFSWQFAGLGHWSFEISLNTKANMLGKLIYWIQACAALEILQCWFSTSHLSNLNQIQNKWYVLLPIFVFTWILIEMLVLEHLCSWKRGHGTHALQHDAVTHTLNHHHPSLTPLFTVFSHSLERISSTKLGESRLQLMRTLGLLGKHCVMHRCKISSAKDLLTLLARPICSKAWW